MITVMLLTEWVTIDVVSKHLEITFIGLFFVCFGFLPVVLYRLL